MEANELRIGNYVLDSYNGKITRINWQEIKWIQEVTDRYASIELTEEILLKCGFIPCSIIDNHFNISGMCIWKCNDMFLCDKNGIHIKHLHQLQNLYFALTGKELEIDLS